MQNVLECFFLFVLKKGDASLPPMLRALGEDKPSPHSFRISNYKISTYQKINVIKRTPHGFFVTWLKIIDLVGKFPSPPTFKAYINIRIYIQYMTPIYRNFKLFKEHFLRMRNFVNIGSTNKLFFIYFKHMFLIYFKHLILWIILINKLAQRNLMNKRVNQGTIIS